MANFCVQYAWWMNRMGKLKYRGTTGKEKDYMDLRINKSKHMGNVKWAIFE